jgi:hypothetical protein
MNDLTKEELLEIKDLIGFDISNYGDLSSKSINILIPMHKKIQSLIDNYCDHSTKEKIKETICCGERLFYASVDWSLAKCGKCGNKLNDNQ